MAQRPYVYYDATVALCATCLRRVDAKVVFQDGRVYMDKRCPDHPGERVLVSDDVAYYRRCREQVLRPSEMPQRFQTPVKWGCPYDCGLCTDHENHACLALIEVTDQCNLRCPTCYADSGPDRPGFRSMEEIEAMLDTVVATEGTADVVQISGGEPTLHPRIWDILDACKARPIQHVMLNTNGVRIANEPEFAKRLASYMPGFEVYLQFDSLREDVLREFRAEDLRDVRRRALENLDAAGVSTNLVVVLKKGLNDDEVGDILQHALSWSCVRGVTFQPVQDAGRLSGFDPATDRLTVSEVRRLIIEQSGLFGEDDVLPVPCHPDGLAMAYALKLGNETVPLSGLVDPSVLLEGRGTIVLESEPAIRDHLVELFRTSVGPDAADVRLKDLLCCLPEIDAPGLGYQNVFRVIVMQFLDAHSLDVRAAKRTCVQIAQPDGRLIPFDTFNLLYRDGKEQNLLGPLREGGLPTLPMAEVPRA